MRLYISSKSFTSIFINYRAPFDAVTEKVDLTKLLKTEKIVGCLPVFLTLEDMIAYQGNAETYFTLDVDYNDKKNNDKK